jgi:hypothetical protein
VNFMARRKKRASLLYHPNIRRKSFFECHPDSHVPAFQSYRGFCR